MMRSAFALLRLSMMVLVANCASAAESFVWKWSVGDTQRYLLTHSLRLQTDAGDSGSADTRLAQETLMRWTVKEVAPDRSAKIECVVERLVMALDDGVQRQARYDSASEDPPAGLATLVTPAFDAMVAAPFEFQMRPTGLVSGIKVSEELEKALEKAPGGALPPERLAGVFQQAGLVFPAGPLEVGQSWDHESVLDPGAIDSVTVTTFATFQGSAGVEDRELAVFKIGQAIGSEGSGDPELTISHETRESDGEFVFDSQAGRVVRGRRSLVAVTELTGRMESTTLTTLIQEIRPVGPDESPAVGVAVDDWVGVE